ncbi:hypothetical protein IPL68_03705 [Candidatus Saccharibacteria bacterium]|nr:MAG: hypothetical protein IPL68_03705 [Candidatus Saccharibacteria bacterium]
MPKPIGEGTYGILPPAISGRPQSRRPSPLHKYRFVLDSVYSVNLLQFQLPYDSINYDIDCPKPNAT